MDYLAANHQYSIKKLAILVFGLCLIGRLANCNDKRGRSFFIAKQIGKSQSILPGIDYLYDIASGGDSLFL